MTNDPERNHYVYFVSSGKAVKVGYTSQQIRQRLRGLQTGSIDPLHCFAYIEKSSASAGRYLEHALRARLKSHYKCPARGEWLLIPHDGVYRTLVSYKRWKVVSCHITLEHLQKSKRLAIAAMPPADADPKPERKPKRSPYWKRMGHKTRADYEKALGEKKVSDLLEAAKRGYDIVANSEVALMRLSADRLSEYLRGGPPASGLLV